MSASQKRSMEKTTHDAGCPAKSGGACECGGPEFVAIGPNCFGFGGTQKEAVRNMKRAGGKSGKTRCVVYRGLADHRFQVSHLDGQVSWRKQDADGNDLPKPEVSKYPAGL